MPTKSDKSKRRQTGASIKIDKDLHQKLKVEAAKQGKTLQDLVEEKLKAAS